MAHEDQKYCHRNRLSEYSESLRQRNSRNRKTEEQIHKILELVKTTGSSIANTLHCATQAVRPQHIPCTFQLSVGTGFEYLDQNTIALCVSSKGKEQIPNQKVLYRFIKAALCGCPQEGNSALTSSTLYITNFISSSSNKLQGLYPVTRKYTLINTLWC